MCAFYLLIRLIRKTLQVSGFILNGLYEIWKPELESKKLLAPSHFLLLDNDQLSDQKKAKGSLPAMNGLPSSKKRSEITKAIK